MTTIRRSHTAPVHPHRAVLAVLLGLFLICGETYAQRGGRGGGGTSSRSSAARSSGSGSVRNASSRSSTPSRSTSMSRSPSGTLTTPTARPTPTKSTPSPATRPATTSSRDLSNRPASTSSSGSRTGLAAATGVAAGAAGASAISHRREGQPPGYGSVNQSERLKQQVRTDPEARQAVAQRAAADPRVRQDVVSRLQSDPAARAAARTYATGAPATRAEARARINASGRQVATTLPAYARPIRIQPYPNSRYRWRRPYRTCYWTGSRWYRPYYYGGYVYYEETAAPIGAEVEELPDDSVEIVTIDGVEYYLIEGAYYQQTEDGFVVVDPYADELDDAAAAGLNLEDSEALRVLQAMSEFVGSLDGFRVDLIETHDDVLETGERFQLSNERRLFITRPDKARAQTLGEGSNRQFWYDGKQVTVYSGVLKTYSTVDAPNTLTEMMAAMSATYGLSFPLADVLFSDIYYAMTEGIMTAEHVGEHEAAGVACDHLAFSQDTIDWEIWVERGEKPVPRKIRISYKLEPGIPVYTSEIMAWAETDESAGAYTFKPPKEAIEIEMEPL